MMITITKCLLTLKFKLNYDLEHLYNFIFLNLQIYLLLLAVDHTCRKSQALDTLAK